MARALVQWPLALNSQQGLCVCGEEATRCCPCRARSHEPLCACTICSARGPRACIAEHILSSHLALCAWAWGGDAHARAGNSVGEPAFVYRVGFDTQRDRWACACEFSTTDWQEMHAHYWQHHVYKPRILVPPRCTHSSEYVVGGFCRGCIKHVRGVDPNNPHTLVWLCMLCNVNGREIQENDPLEHWRKHAGLVRQYEIQRQWVCCKLCRLVGVYHFHLIDAPLCPCAPGCNGYHMSNIHSGNTASASRGMHFLTMVCQVPGCSKDCLWPVDYAGHAEAHMRDFELRNALVLNLADRNGHWPRLRTALLSRNVEISDLIWTTTDFPYAELYRRTELKCAPAEESPLSYDNLRPKVWGAIIAHLDIRSLARLRMTSKRTRACADSIEHFGHFTGGTWRDAVDNAVRHLVPVHSILRFVRESPLSGQLAPEALLSKRPHPTFETESELRDYLWQELGLDLGPHVSPG